MTRLRGDVYLFGAMFKFGGTIEAGVPTQMEVSIFQSGTGARNIAENCECGNDLRSFEKNF